MAVIDRSPTGELRGTNLFELRPQWAWLAALSPMPLFFAAAGWANATTTLASSARRLAQLVGLGAVVIGLWSAALVIVTALGSAPDTISDGARLATQPLWFLAAYLPLAAASPKLGLMARHPMLSVGALLAFVAALDAARFAGGAPRWVGYPGFLAAWAVPWVLGTSWRHQVGAASTVHDRARQERRIGALLAGVGLLAGWALVRYGGYSPTLLDVVPGRRSNTTPPTVYTAVASIAQVGVFMLLATLCDRFGTRFAKLVARGGSIAVPLYVLHLSGLALCAGCIAAGLAVPTRLSTAFWLTRPVWLAAVVSTTAVLMLIVERVRRVLARRPRAPHGWPGAAQAPWAGIAIAAFGAAFVGLVGPRTVPTAAISFGCFLLGWELLRSNATVEPAD